MTLPRLELDYVARPRRPRLLGVAILVVSLGTAVLLLEQYREVRLGMARLDSARGAPVQSARPAGARPEEELRRAEAVLRQLALPWGSIVRALEEAATPEVAILQLQPEAQQRQLKLSLEARGQEAMLKYVRRLAASPSLTDVHVASHQVMLDDPLRPLQFTVLARFK